MRRTLLYAATARDDDNNADGVMQAAQKNPAAGLRREQGMRRTLLYASTARDDDNNADGAF